MARGFFVVDVLGVAGLVSCRWFMWLFVSGIGGWGFLITVIRDGFIVVIVCQFFFKPLIYFGEFPYLFCIIYMLFFKFYYLVSL